MTLRVSNPVFFEVLEAPPAEGVGWYLQALSEIDYSTVVAKVYSFTEFGFQKEHSGPGGGTVMIPSDDPLWTTPLPTGQSTPLIDQEALWQVVEGGAVRFEFLAQDVERDVVPEGINQRQHVISGQGTGLVLDWATTLPEGFPAFTELTREFNGPVMAAWKTLFDEAQDRGAIPFVKLLFDASTDSAGNPWPDDQTVSVSPGSSLLHLLNSWVESIGGSWFMLPGFRLQVFGSHEGNHREDEVVFHIGGQQTKHRQKKTRRDLHNAIYVHGKDLEVSSAVDTPSQSKWKRRERWVQAGEAADATARNSVALTTLGLYKDQRSSREIQVLYDAPSRRIFADYDVGDWVRVETEDDDTESGVLRVLVASVRGTAAGGVDLELTVGSRFDAREVKLQRLLEKLGASSLPDNPTAQPIPPTAVVTASKLGDLADVDVAGATSGSVLTRAGSVWADTMLNLDDLSDVDTVSGPPDDEDYLGYEQSSGLWVPKPLPPSVSPWLQPINLPLNTLTGWTVGTGTWGVDADGINQSDTSALARRLRYTAAQHPLAEAVFELEIRRNSGPSGNNYAGINLGTSMSSDTSGGILVRLRGDGAGSDWLEVQVENDSLASSFPSALDTPIPFTEWVQLRVHKVGSVVSVWVNGVLELTVADVADARFESTFALWASAINVTFRNLKVWTPNLPF